MAKEIERRWVVGNYVTGDLQLPSKHIAQGYIDGERDVSTRIRIIDGKQAIKGIKRGQGVVREELEEPVSLEEGERLLATTDAVLHKDRIKLDGWDVDKLTDSFFCILNALPLIIAERELASRDERVELPSWVLDSVEVTELLCSEFLALFKEMVLSQPPKPDYESGYDDGLPVTELPDGARAILLCGGTEEERSSLTTKLLAHKPDKLVDAHKIATWLFPKDPTLFQAFMLKSLLGKKKAEQEALFVLSGQTYADCWKGLIQANPFGMDGDNVLTIVLDQAQVALLDDREWVNSDAFTRHSKLEGKMLLDYWAGAHDVYFLGQTASPEMQDWALMTVVKAFFSRG